MRHGIKTKKSSEVVYKEHMPDHIEKGIAILKHAREHQKKSRHKLSID